MVGSTCNDSTLWFIPLEVAFGINVVFVIYTFKDNYVRQRKNLGRG